MARYIVILRIFANLVENEARSTEEEFISASAADERITNLLITSDPPTIEAIRDPPVDGLNWFIIGLAG